MMPVVSAPTTTAARKAAPKTAVALPLQDGATVIDLLLQELNPHDTVLIDAALDLRFAATVGNHAGRSVRHLFRLRQLLAGRHYPAFYRVRCWATRALRVEVRAERCARWRGCELPLNCARLDEVVNTALASLAQDGAIPPGAHVRFAFAAATTAA